MSVSRIIFTGADGQVGLALRALWGAGCGTPHNGLGCGASADTVVPGKPSALSEKDVFPQAVPLTRGELDLGAGESELRAAAQRILSATAPTLWLNLAAYTAVDAAEQNQPLAHQVNAVAPAVLAQLCAQHQVEFVQVSTDYVFGDGPAGGVCERQPADPVQPLNTYGRTKAEGEAAVLKHGGMVVRTSWVYGNPDTHPGFVATMRRLAQEGAEPNVVADQWGRPTYAPDLARGLHQLTQQLAEVRRRVGTVLHVAGGGELTTWHGLASELFRLLGQDPQHVRPIPTADYPTPARRPCRSALGVESWIAAGLDPLPAWRESLARALG